MRMFATALVIIVAVGAIDGAPSVLAASASQATGQTTAAAQDPPQTQPPAGRGGSRGRAGGASLPNPDGMTPMQVEQLFDAYVVMQARTVLRLAEDKQSFPFMDRMQRLQMLRRRIQRQRQENLRELRALLGQPAFDETAAAAKIKALDDIVAQAGEQIRQAYADIDQILTPRQRAQFRVFEEQMERQKLDMLARARQQAGEPTPPAPPVIRR